MAPQRGTEHGSRCAAPYLLGQTHLCNMSLIHVCTHVSTHICTDFHALVLTCLYTCLHTYRPGSISHANTCVAHMGTVNLYTHANTHVDTHVAHMSAHISTHAYLRTRPTHMSAHVSMHMHTYTFVNTLLCTFIHSISIHMTYRCRRTLLSAFLHTCSYPCWVDLPHSLDGVVGIVRREKLLRDTAQRVVRHQRDSPACARACLRARRETAGGMRGKGQREGAAGRGAGRGSSGAGREVLGQHIIRS